MSIVESLHADGFLHLNNKSLQDIEGLCNSLGEVILETDVKINLKTKALVTSDCELDMHTDHSKVKYILWHCLRQTSIGGHSLLLDSQKILEKISESDKVELKKIQLFEHKIFKDDCESFPILTSIGDNYKVYYSFWFINKKNKDNPAFLNFRNIIDSTEKINIKLSAGDVLIIDNDRMFHGRTKISGNKKRHLRRYWLK